MLISKMTYKTIYDECAKGVDKVRNDWTIR